MKRFSLCFGMALAVGTSLIPAFAQQGPGARPAGPRPLIGKITEKGDNGFRMLARQRGGDPVQMKVEIADGAKIDVLEKGAAGDIKEGYLVAVYGTRDGDKVTAQGIARLMKLEGAPNMEALRGILPLLMITGRMVGAQPGTRPVVGKVTAANPLKVQTREGEVAVQTSDTIQVACLAESSLVKLAADGNVIVIAKEEPKDNVVTANTVIQVPAFGPGDGRRNGARRQGQGNEQPGGGASQ